MRSNTNMMREQIGLNLTVQFVDVRHKALLPRVLLRRWVKAALFKSAEVTLRFVDSIEGLSLNNSYRGKNYATNVLTFFYSDPEQDQIVQTDIVLCPEVIEREAKAQDKELIAHYAHLIIHGILHAQGYSHDEEEEAKKMESLEISLLAKLEFANPYQTEH